MMSSAYERIPSFNTDLEHKIAAARQEARLLFAEVDNVRKTIQDTTLYGMSRQIAAIAANTTNVKLYNTLKGHQDKVAQIRWCSDSNTILSASQDGFMIIWDPVTGLKKQAIVLENSWVLTCAYSPSGALVASAGLDNACTVTQVKQDPFAEFGQPVKNSVKNNTHNLSSSSQETYQMYGNFQHSLKAVFKSHTAYVSDCDFIDENSIVTASGDMSCCLWDIQRGKKIRTFNDHLGDVLCLSVNKRDSNTDSGNRNPNLFISGGSDGAVKVWDFRAQAPVQKFAVSNSDVNCLQQLRDGNTFASGSDDGIVRLFDLRSDCELNSYFLPALLKSNKYDSFSDGNRIAQSPFQQALSPANHGALPSPSSFSHVSNSTNTANSIHSTYDTPGVISLDCSKSGRLIYACYSNYGCIIWDTLKNEILGTVGSSNHSNIINQVKVSPDGIGLCTSSWDSTIKVWSV